MVAAVLAFQAFVLLCRTQENTVHHILMEKQLKKMSEISIKKNIRVRRSIIVCKIKV